MQHGIIIITSPASQINPAANKKLFAWKARGDKSSAYYFSGNQDAASVLCNAFRLSLSGGRAAVGEFCHVQSQFQGVFPEPSTLRFEINFLNALFAIILVSAS